MMFEKTWGLTVLALSVGACSPALDWRELRPDGGDVVALFPCKPQRFQRPLTLAGEAVRMHLVSCVAQGVIYALSHATLADPANVSPALTELRAAAAGNIGGTPALLGALNVPGMTPNPLAQKLAMAGSGVDGKPVNEQAGFFVRGLTVYQATIVGPQIDPVAADTFFTGLKLPS